MAESAEAEKSLAGGAEAGAGSADDVSLGEEEIKEIPGAHASRGLQPDIGGVHTAIDGEPGGAESVANDAGVFHVVIDDSSNLGFSFLAVDCGGSRLDGIGNTVELGCLPAIPKLVEADRLSVSGVSEDGLGHNGVSAASASEAGGLGETPKLDSAFLRPGNLVNGMGDVALSDKGFVR